MKVPLKLLSSPLDTRRNQVLFHDWQRGGDREAVMAQLSQDFGFDPAIDLRGAHHPREIQICYRDGQVVRLYLDQGFGYWQTAGRDRFDFAARPIHQAKQLRDAVPIVLGNGHTYLAVAPAGA